MLQNGDVLVGNAALHSCVKEINRSMLVSCKVWETNEDWKNSLLQRCLAAMCWLEAQGYFRCEGNNTSEE